MPDEDRTARKFGQKLFPSLARHDGEQCRRRRVSILSAKPRTANLTSTL